MAGAGIKDLEPMTFVAGTGRIWSFDFVLRYPLHFAFSAFYTLDAPSL